MGRADGWVIESFSEPPAIGFDADRNGGLPLEAQVLTILANRDVILEDFEQVRHYFTTPQLRRYLLFDQMLCAGPIDLEEFALPGGYEALRLLWAEDLRCPHQFSEYDSTANTTIIHGQPLPPGFFDPPTTPHAEDRNALTPLKITTILGDRLDLSSIKAGKTTPGSDGKEERVVRILGGREISAELIVAVPNNPAAPDMPVDSATEGGDEHLHVPHPHLFAIGDAADAFGAMNSGRSSYFQAEVATSNILKLINRSERLGTHGNAGDQADSSNDDFKQFTPGPPMIKTTLGLTKQLYEVDGEVGTKMDGTPDLEAHRMWQFYGAETDEDKMYE
ncbi:hypothetical protein WOLCODRAFT_158045 [Wolfiporia cocos MD-104 SS10]|uniref:FAD/NAD(P)-binding domain-containing protein n=1 Tax=Wolfiporia cocos (strain MD-104) TaxID=742152 RepID=A0A2H3J4Z4_WOLCO|nr:hypothetical protein WOLCODRAFT_158045 [Wolfiporia cocos MD-104 SS10]